MGACATADPLLDLAIPLDDACEAGSKDCDLSLLQVRGQLKIADEPNETSSAAHTVTPEEANKQQTERKAKKDANTEKKKEEKETKKKDKEETKTNAKLSKEEDQENEDKEAATTDGAFLFETSPAGDKKAVKKEKKTQEKETKKEEKGEQKEEKKEGKEEKKETKTNAKLSKEEDQENEDKEAATADGAFLFETSPAGDKKAVKKEK